MMNLRTVLFLAIVICGCSDSAGKGAPDIGPDTAADRDAEVPNDPSDVGVDAGRLPGDQGGFRSSLVLMQQLAGLWVGPASQTPLGTFPIMVMDFRAADPNVLFARTDLDADNALRMAFFIELIGETSDIVFRNGGLFMGLGRDTRTTLQSYDPEESTWRFCEPTGGCEYLDAVISFDGADELTMDVKVRGAQHMLWTASRVEERELPQPFPAELDPIGTGDAEFPPMPSLAVELSWADAAPDGAWVWVVLSDTACGLTGQGCQASRSMGMALQGGATDATLTFEQLHAGAYHLNAVLDRDGNFQSVPFPQNPDAIVFPVDPVVEVVFPTTTTTHQISFDVP